MDDVPRVDEIECAVALNEAASFGAQRFKMGRRLFETQIFAVNGIGHALRLACHDPQRPAAGNHLTILSKGGGNGIAAALKDFGHRVAERGGKVFQENPEKKLFIPRAL
jgi:hypothetical protein